MDRYTYSSAQTKGPLNRLSEITSLLKMAYRPAQSSVDWVVNLRALTEERIQEVAGFVPRGCKGLDIGPGQKLGCLRCFSLDNDVVGIDTDWIPQGFSPSEYLQMFKRNSATRVMKTLGRKALGVDSRFERSLAKRLGVRKLPKARVLHMNAGALTFEDDSFDFVYSHSVFEHIDDPERALREVARVLRPGGAAYLGIHLYTCHSGCHDPRLLVEEQPKPPYWPHLRTNHAPAISSNAFLNKIRAQEWEEMFERTMPGTRFYRERQDDWMLAALADIRANGELEGYTDDELMTINLVGVWRKPGGAILAHAS